MLTERRATVYSADRYLGPSYPSVKQTRPADRSLADHPLWTCHADILSSIVSCVIGLLFKGVVNCQNSRDKGLPEGNSARG